MVSPCNRLASSAAMVKCADRSIDFCPCIFQGFAGFRGDGTGKILTPSPSIKAAARARIWLLWCAGISAMSGAVRSAAAMAAIYILPTEPPTVVAMVSPVYLLVTASSAPPPVH